MITEIKIIERITGKKRKALNQNGRLKRSHTGRSTAKFSCACVSLITGHLPDVPQERTYFKRCKKDNVILKKQIARKTKRLGREYKRNVHSKFPGL